MLQGLIQYIAAVCVLAIAIGHMKDTRSLLLVLLSFGLIATWAYHFYDKSNYSKPKQELLISNSVAEVNKTRDSLQQAYSTTINNLDLQLDSTRNVSDSLQTALNEKINEINRLKTEISNILSRPAATSSELLVARQKMKEMEEIIRQLREEKIALDQEKKQLSTQLDNMNTEVTSLQKNIRRADEDNKNLTDKIKQASVFVASALHFTTLHTNDEKEQETSLARKADKFVASFILQNNFNEFPNTEVMIVINQPDGHVLQNSAWDSGSFDSKTDGKKYYTRKMRFDYMKGEQKALIFTLEFEQFQKGTYTLQIWHNGVMIGQTTKTLS